MNQRRAPTDSSGRGAGTRPKHHARRADRPRRRAQDEHEAEHAKHRPVRSTRITSLHAPPRPDAPVRRPPPGPAALQPRQPHLTRILRARRLRSRSADASPRARTWVFVVGQGAARMLECAAQHSRHARGPGRNTCMMHLRLLRVRHRQRPPDHTNAHGAGRAAAAPVPSAQQPLANLELPRPLDIAFAR